ncbi:MAG: energy transducer TonB [Candidatus Acidiferrales bacterium]|jgi:TonB family protein
MNGKKRLLGFGLAVILGGSLAAGPRVNAQENSQDNAKRKVKTKTVPEYPELARRINATGKVKIEATISADGRVTSTKVIGGSPLLVGAATDALKKWRFEPATKESVEVVEFDFSGNN